MWNCNWGNPYEYGGWFSAYGIFGWLINILILFTIMYILFRITMAFIPNKSRHASPDSLEILKIKLANGDINEKEYRRIKEILTHSN